MRTDSLMSHHGFARLWASHTAGQGGTFVGQTVLPLLAATVLAASPIEMGLLTAAGTVAFLVIGLPAGVWVDRTRRRPLMLRADFVRAGLLLTVPLAWWLGLLTFAQLVVVALLVGAATVFFDIAAQSYLPGLVGRARLVAGNSRLESSMSVAQIVGPAVGGGLAQLVGVANATLAPGIGYLASGAFLLGITSPEPSPRRDAGIPLRVQISEGLRFVFGDPALRVITLCTTSVNFMITMLVSMQILFLTRDVGLTPGGVGAVLAVAGVGGVLGALSAGWWARRIGQARSIWLVPMATWPAALLAPLGRPGWSLALVVVGFTVRGFGTTVFNVAQVSYRQSICPDRLLGRMNASIRTVVWGGMPVGALLGGVLGESIGVRATMWVASAGITLTAVLLLVSPLRRLYDLPAAHDLDPAQRGGRTGPLPAPER